MSESETLRVQLGDRSYNIHISQALQAKALKELISDRKVFAVSDSNVAPLYLKQCEDALGTELAHSIIPAGEASKSLKNLELISGDLLKHRMDRKGILIALGGGVVGDLAGFTAAAYMRGIDFIQIPTTLLSMVDSSVGGKTGVNHPNGKNMIGAFHQPLGVFASMQSLSTLAPREYKAGLAEVIKYGIIEDAELFEWIEAHTQELLALEPKALSHAIKRSCEIKADIVREDERETSGRRAILNLGHTFGHAEEALMGYGEVLHGEAVAAGMVAACRVAESLGQIDQPLSERLIKLLQTFDLPTNLQSTNDFNAFWSCMEGDKKNSGGEVKFIIPTKLGHCGLPQSIQKDLIKEAIL